MVFRVLEVQVFPFFEPFGLLTLLSAAFGSTLGFDVAHSAAIVKFMYGLLLAWKITF